MDVEIIPDNDPNLGELFEELCKADDPDFGLAGALADKIYEHLHLILENPQTTVLSVQSYMTALETGKTDDVCNCIWQENDNGVKWIMTEHPLCRVHSQEGRILGFLRYWAKGCKL